MSIKRKPPFHLRGGNPRAIAILVGTTIGAGIFGLPFAVARVGFGAGLIYLLVLGGLILLLNLLYGEVILRTVGDRAVDWRTSWFTLRN